MCRVNYVNELVITKKNANPFPGYWRHKQLLMPSTIVTLLASVTLRNINILRKRSLKKLYASAQILAAHVINL